MRRKLAAAQRLTAVRARIRDVAAADYATANQALAAKVDELAAARRRRQEASEGVDLRLKIAADVRKLELVRAEMAAAGDAVRRAEAEIQHATMRARRIAAALREKERELRTSERVVERLQQRRARSAARTEQAMVDDLIAARWRGE